MQAISLLTERQSTPLLTHPGPTQSQLDIILKAGMRAPDHAGLQPWFFHLVNGAGLNKLGDLFVEVVTAQGADAAKIEKASKMPHRAPLIIVITTQYQTHDKVPFQEQLVAAGCAVHAMQMACYAQGLGAMWRSGDMAYQEKVRAAFNVSGKDEIVGFLYVGTPCKEVPTKPEKPYQDKVAYF